MIAVFGATSDIGGGLVGLLQKSAVSVRAAPRSLDVTSAPEIEEFLSGCTTLVSCLHAKYVAGLLASSPPSITKFVFVGSAWRYSNVANFKADQVRAAESAFIASAKNGVMLHPTMIYGGRQENNISRLISAIRMLPVIPAPGGGGQRVQPIFIDDVISSLGAAVHRNWDGPNVMPVAGPPLSWREMASICSEGIGLNRRIISVPASPVMAAFSLLHSLGLEMFDPGIIRRFSEDVNIPLCGMIEGLSVRPADFRTGLQRSLERWQNEPVA